MNRCEQTQFELTNALAEGNLHTPAELQAHLRGCATCRQAWQEMRLTWRALGALTEEEVPAKLWQTTRARVLRELEREQANAESARVGKSALVSVTLGVVFSVASVWVLGQKSDLSAFSPQVLLSMGAAWAALYAVAVLLGTRGDGAFARVDRVLLDRPGARLLQDEPSHAPPFRGRAKPDPVLFAWEPLFATSASDRLRDRRYQSAEASRRARPDGGRGVRGSHVAGDFTPVRSILGRRKPELDFWLGGGLPRRRSSRLAGRGCALSTVASGSYRRRCCDIT